MPKQSQNGFSSAFSPFVRVLPELEQQVLFNSINFSVNQTSRYLSPENYTAATFTISGFLCPSDGFSVYEPLGMNNYRANLGAGVANFPSSNEVGAFGFQVWISPSQFVDGMSSTALVSERLRGDNDQRRWDPARDYWFADTDSITTNDAIIRCAKLPTDLPPHFSKSGESWFLFGYDRCFYNHIIPPNSSDPDCSLSNIADKIDGGEDGGIHAARSLHSGGVNVAKADGSINFITSSISSNVWRAFGTRAGGEIIGVDAQ
jgi:prepilin-type processing-associated H-X9-DG protein